MNPFAPAHDALAPAGPAAASIADLWWFYFWFLAIITVLVVSAVIVAIARRRQRATGPLVEPGLRAETIPNTAPPARAVRTLEDSKERRYVRNVIGLGAATLIALFVLLVASVLTDRTLASMSKADPVHIEVTGAQWWWKVRYLNGDPSQIFLTANELHLPVGRPVSVRLLAADVIHSFWIPNLQGKRDLIPGHENSLWLRADKPGIYRGQCAEFCGYQHANMAFTVIVESNADFEAWCEGQRRPPPPPQNESALRGQSLFQNGPCASCHTVSGTAAQGSSGPDLSHFKSRSSLAAGTLPNRRGHLAGWVVNSQAQKPGNRMPAITLPGSDLQDLLAYLETLR